MPSAGNGRQPEGGDRFGPADAVVVRRVLGGDRDLYRTLIRRYQERFHRHAVGMVGDPDAATDLVQDTFFRAYTTLETCTSPSSFGLWAYGILCDRCGDYLRNLQGGSTSTEEREELLSPVAGVQPSDASDLDWTLGDALACLPGAHREAFLLKHLQDQSYREIAEMLGTSVDAVKMRVRRSREILRCHVEDRAKSRGESRSASPRSSVPENGGRSPGSG